MLKKKTSEKLPRNDLPEIIDVADADEPLATVLYGRPGSGKTTLSSTWPKPILYLDMNDKGIRSIKDVKGAQVAYIENSKQLEAMFWELKDGNLKYKSVVLDTMTRLQHMIQVEVTGTTDNRWGNISRKDYGEITSQTKKVIDDFRDLPINVIFIAQQRMFNIDEEAESRGDLQSEVGPALMPSVATHLNSSVSIVGQMFLRRRFEEKKIGKRTIKKEFVEHCLWIKADSVRDAKIRKPKGIELPSYIVNPSYDSLMDIIEGE